jgi:hypothetical protein
MMGYGAGQCIISLIQFSGWIEAVTTKRIKEMLLKSDSDDQVDQQSKGVNLLKYIGRHLVYHDRYLKTNKG